MPALELTLDLALALGSDPDAGIRMLAAAEPEKYPTQAPAWAPCPPTRSGPPKLLLHEIIGWENRKDKREY